MFELTYQLKFEAARHLPHLPEAHPCSRTHGHSFQVTLILRGEKQPHVDWVVDYHEIQSKGQALVSELDHRLLNEVKGLENPTTENITQWLYERLKTPLPQLHQVTVSETSESSCRYPLS